MSANVHFAAAQFAAAGFAALAAVHPASASAADAAPSAVAEVVVSGAPFPVSIDSATTHVEILKRSDIDLLPPAGLGDTLSSVPGVRSSAFGPGASRPIIRGLSGARVLVLENGVGLVDASTLSPDHAVAADPSEATRIEVLRGPSTLAYGGSGIGGVVNVIDDRIPTKAPGAGASGRLSGAYGTVDQGRSLSAGATFGKGPLVFHFDGSKRRSDDYKVSGPPASRALADQFGASPTPDDKVLNTDVDLLTFGGGVSYVNDRGYVGVAVRRVETDYGIPFAQITPADPAAEGPIGISLRQTRYDLRGEQRVDLGPFEKLRFSVGHADYHHVEIGRETGEEGTRFLSKGTEGRLELVQPSRNGWDGAIGFQGLTRDFQAIGDEAFIPPVKIKEAGAFVLQRLDKGAWGIEGGARIDRRTLKTATDERGFTNGSASLGLFARPAEPWFFALSLSHNRRSPTEIELFADGPHAGTNAFEIGDPNLRPESVNSAEVTARYSTGPLRLEGHVYVARYNGFIDERPTGEVEDDLPVYQHVQIDARFVGAELEGAYTVWRSGAQSLAVEATFDWVRGSSDLGPVARIPPWGVFARLVYSSAWFDAQAELHRVGGQDRVAEFETPTDGYTQVNLRASVKPWANRPLRLFAEGRNIGDVKAREHVSFLKDIAPLPGRNFRVGFSASF